MAGNVRKWLWPLVVVALATGAFFGYRALRPKTVEAVKAATVSADRGNVVAKVTAGGTLSALVTVQVGSQVSGRIQQLFADFNSPVKKGQVLAKLDPQLFDAALAQSRANYTAAEANLKRVTAQADEAKRQLARTQSLADRKLVADAEFDTARANAAVADAQVESAAASLEQARASLSQAKVNLAYTTITSPIDGIVISRSVDVGQTVAASFQAPTLFVLAEDLRKMQVDTSVAEADVGRLEAGMPAIFTVDAYPGEKFEGTVRQIRNAPQTVQNVVTYDAVIDVANPALELRPGMTANVTFAYAERNDVVRLPNAALRFRAPAGWAQNGNGSNGARRRNGGGAPAAGVAPGTVAVEPGSGARPAATHAGDPSRRTVWVLRDGQPKAVHVKLGLSDGSMTELVEGDVKPGDALVIDVPNADAGKRGFRLF